MRFRHAILPLLAAAITAMTAELRAEPALPLGNPEAAAAWKNIAGRFESGPELRRDRDGRIISARMKRLRRRAKGGGWVEIQIDPAAGEVVRLSADGAAFTNDELADFAAFPQLQSLKLFHNGPHLADANPEDYDGSGLAALHHLGALSELIFAGSPFDDDGMAAAAGLPALESLGVWHTRVTDVGLAAFQDHPALRRIRLKPFWEKRITDAGLAALAKVPHLESLSVGETYFTGEGLSLLVPMHGRLTEVDLSNCLIQPAAVESLREAMPEASIKWEGLAGAGAVLGSSKFYYKRIADWAPPPLLQQALQAAPPSE